MMAPPSNLTRLYYNGPTAKSHSTTTQYHQLRKLELQLMWWVIGLASPVDWGETGGSQSPASRTPLSRLPYVFVPLSLNSRPLLCFSCYHVNHPVWLPIEILKGSALALSKIKNCVVNRTTPHFPARSLKRHSFDTSLHHAAKSSLQCFVNYSRKKRAPRKVFHGWIFPHQTEKY